MTSTTKAKRGDLVAIERETSCTSTTSTTRRTSIDVHIVTSVTREGVVKATRPVHGSDLGRETEYGPEKPQPIARIFGLRARYVIGAQTIHVPSAIAAVLAHHYPGHPNQLQPFDSLDELRSILRPFLVRQEVYAR